MTSPQDQKHVPLLIVGGGIGGLSAALAIARKGRPVHLVEQALEFSEIGAGLQVGPNAVRALDRLGVLQQVTEIAVHPRNGVLMDAVSGERLTTLDLGPSFRQRYGYPYLVLHRHDLLDILLAACRATPGITLETRRRVVEVESSDDWASVRFSDGTIYSCDVLVGADGIHSRVRTLIDDRQPDSSGHVAYRGTLPMSEVSRSLANDDVVLWIGPHLHLMQYPVRRGEIYNQVAVFESERYARGEDTYGAVDELEERFSVTCQAVRESVELIAKDRFWLVFDREPLSTWIAGRAILIGDAAHPMLQYLGQGACQALEDSVELARQLARYPDAPAQALRRFESARIALTSRCQRVARPWGQLWHTQDPMMLALRNRVFRTRPADDYSDFDWLYLDHEVEAETPDAMKTQPERVGM